MSVSAHLPFDTLNGALKAAGEETRLRILVLLAEAELTVSDLTQILRQSQPRISRHLKLLVEAGLIERFREGTWAFFRLAEHGGGAEVARALLDHLNPADQTIARDQLERAGLKNCSVRQGDLYDLPLGNDSFDVIILHQVLHFLDDGGRAIREPARARAPGGGRLLFDFPPPELEFLREQPRPRRGGFPAETVTQWISA